MADSTYTIVITLSVDTGDKGYVQLVATAKGADPLAVEQSIKFDERSSFLRILTETGLVLIPKGYTRVLGIEIKAEDGSVAKAV